jgi:DNA-binding transcriptional ArsR family regulator
MRYAFAVDAVATAIADPVRRAIMVMLRTERLSAGEIAGRFAISRPAVSRHLRVLRTSGLVRDEIVGRQRFYALDVRPLAELDRWLDGFTPPSGWERRLDALETEVYRARRDRRRRDAAHPNAEAGTDDRRDNIA